MVPGKIGEKELIDLIVEGNGNDSGRFAPVGKLIFDRIRRMERDTVLYLKPKKTPVIALLMLLSVAQTLVFAANVAEVVPINSVAAFAVNGLLLILLGAAFGKLVSLERYVYSFFEESVTETRGILNRITHTVPVDKIFGYKVTRSISDLLFGTSHLTLEGSTGLPVLEISFVDAEQAKTAERLLEALIARNRQEIAEKASQVQSG